MMTDKGGYFPISLGNHYYTNRVLQQISNSVACNYKSNQLVICDRLRCLSYGIRGVERGLIKNKVELEIHQFYSRLQNVSFDFQLINVQLMTDIFMNVEFNAFANSFYKEISSKTVVSKYIHEIVDYTLDKLSVQHTDYNVKVQSRYFLEETAMSIYVTEILGFNCEYYKSLDRGLIVLLYDEYPSMIKELVSKTKLSRKFFSLKELII